jgi:DNA polymerase-3 subunit gamma/tau
VYSSQAFARKYRPQKFSDVLGQDHVTKALKNIFSASEMKHHAYLLTGTRGVGKTTLARICAKLANCLHKNTQHEPCLKCHSCLEIDHSSSMNYVELDGASNNGIEQIRQLIDTTQYMPIEASKKIYVIDEVHMLSQSAFNALLKTLEEPPAHVVFIFATTEVHKIPETILSRCLRFDLRPLSVDLIQQHLQKVLELEQISVDQPSTVRSIAHCARGSVRDGLNLLEQVLALAETKKLTDQLVSLSLGRLQTSQVQNLLKMILDQDHKQLSVLFQEMLQKNVDLETLSFQLHEELYNTLQDHITHKSKIYPLEELFWMFEQMTKDFQWVHKSLSSHHVLHALFLKYALRKTLIQNQLQNQQTTNSTATATPEQKKKLTVEELWQKAYEYLLNQSPAAASTWSHTWGKIQQQDHQGAQLSVCYKEADHFLVESFSGNQWWNKVREYIAQLMEINPSSLKMELMAIIDQEEMIPKSILEQKEEENKRTLEQRKSEILQHVGVRQIESLFNAKVDKVHLK